MLRLRTFGGLWIEGQDGTRVASPRPRRLALLAILAAVGRRGISRARLRAIFWPDTDDDRARHALSQTLYALRRDLGLSPITTDTELRLDPATMTSDTEQFRDAITRSDWAEVDRLYEGPFAAGFSLDDAPEFNRWIDDERGVFAREAEAALAAAVRDAEAAGDAALALRARHRLATLAPLSALHAVSYIGALAARGDRAGALAHARQHVALVRSELDCEPDPSVVHLVERLRTTGEPRQPTPPAAPPGDADAGNGGGRESGQPVATSGSRRWVARPLSVALLGLIAIGVAAVAVLASWTKEPVERVPVLAVGQLRDLTAPDSVRLGDVLSEVVATSLARIGGVEVIANSRIIELMAPGTDTLRAARTDAARRAGASEIIEGELVASGVGQLRLDLRRIDLRRGALRGGYSVTGTDRLGLIDSVASLVAADFESEPPLRSLADLTPRSPIALRLYEEGLRAHYQSDPASAERLFREALAEDSTFAMAAVYAYRVVRGRGGDDPVLEARAVRLAASASDRDRLLILTAIRLRQNEPVAAVLAESLATRYPRDPEALLRAAEPLVHQRNTAADRELLERAIAIDSAARTSPIAPCRLCAAFSLLGWQLAWADSGEAGERVFRRWVALQPQDPNAIHELAMLQFMLGRFGAGVRTMGLLARLPSDVGFDDGHRLFLGRLLTGDLEQADAECMARLRREGDPRTVASYLWLCPIVWRNQGRYQDAYGFVVAGRLPGGGQIPRQRDLIGEVVLDLEMNRPLLALRALESAVPRPGPERPPGQLARELTWNLVHRGTAAAMAHEFELARRLADSAEVVGRGSLYGRDRLLHFFVRGLIARSSGDHVTAVDFFRRSVFSPTFGFTRANLELARGLMALGRAAEAIAPLRAALRGGWDGSNLYVTRTELHELLAQAFDAVGVRDSAAAHFTAVERAWRHADPEFAPRYQAVRDWLAHQMVGET